MYDINVVLNKIILVINLSTCVMPSLLDNKYEEITNDQIQKDAINIHNYYRGLHGSPPLQHQKKLEDFAKKRAVEIAQKDGRNFKHPPDLEYGENLAWNSIEYIHCQIPLFLWYYEWKNPGYDFNKPHIYPKNAHFTQMIWKDTKKIGCGQAISKGIKGGTYTVCNYDPPGNWIGEEKANVKPQSKKDSTKAPDMRATFGEHTKKGGFKNLLDVRNVVLQMRNANNLLRKDKSITTTTKAPKKTTKPTKKITTKKTTTKKTTTKKTTTKKPTAKTTTKKPTAKTITKTTKKTTTQKITKAPNKTTKAMKKTTTAPKKTTPKKKSGK